jgi:hypothetical protein
VTAHLILRQPCEHGEVGRHPRPVVLKDHLGPGKDDVGYDWGNMCPGGSETVLDADKVLVEHHGEWQYEAWTVTDVLTALEGEQK